MSDRGTERECIRCGTPYTRYKRHLGYYGHYCPTHRDMPLADGGDDGEDAGGTDSDENSDENNETTENEPDDTDTENHEPQPDE